MPRSFPYARDLLSKSVFGTSVIGAVATVGVVAAGAAVLEAALLPGLLIGGVAVLAPRFLRRDMFGALSDTLRRAAPEPAVAATKESASDKPAPFDTRRAVFKTVTYRALVTTADFGANYFVIGELALAAGLSSLSLVAGPLFYFAHEWGWHYYGPVSAYPVHARGAETTDSPRPEDAQTSLAGFAMSRALGKTITYEGVTAVSEFSVNYLFVRDLASAAGMTAFSMAVSPIIYYLHEKAWDYYDASTAPAPIPAELKLLPAPAR